MGFENILVEAADGVCRITVNRPDKMNALNRQTVQEIVAAVDSAERDQAVRAIVITGAGEKAFVAGADIEEMSELSAAEGESWSRYLQQSFDRLENCRKPVVAAINGFALGGGCELAMACHVRIAVEGARFGQPEVNLGLIPGAGGTQRLQRIVGRGRALDLTLTGDMIDAAEAYRIGLASQVVAADGLDEAIAGYVKKLSKKSPIALSRAIDAVLVGGEMAQAEAQRFEAGLFGLCFATADMREGTQAFLEKRKPAFKGE